MSNLNAKNIISENITVTNLNVININGLPYTSNKCGNCNKGYYIPCPDCDYVGPDICDCGNPCDSVPFEPDVCDCYVPCNKCLPDGPKSFVINHPIQQDKYLVHACLEGPEAGVYYRGTGVISNNNSTVIELPEYVGAFATDFTIQLTPIYNGKINILNVSEIIDNKFTVYGENGKFYWNVIGKRLEIVTEPLKTDVEVKGQGPYLYI